MLAIDRLRKILGSLHLQPTPISPVSSCEVQATSNIPHFTGSRSPGSIISGNPHIESFSPISLRTYSPSYDMMRHVNLKSSGDPVTLSPSQVNVPSFCSGSVQQNPGSRLANVFPLSCQSCSSFRRNCENVCQNEIIGPAPPLPCKSNYKPGLSSTLTRNGIVSFAKEMENVNLTHPHQDWFPEKKQIGKMRTRGREMPCDMYSGTNDYHLSSYGTLPRGISFKGKGSSLCQHYGGLRNNFYDWYEAENVPVESFSNAGMGRDFERQQISKPPTPPKRMNSFKTDAPMFGIAGEKLHPEASTPFHSSGLRLLDAVNLEGNFQRFCDGNYRPFGFSRPENQQLNRDRILSREFAVSNRLNQAPAHVANCDMTYRRDFNMSKSSAIAEIQEQSSQYAAELNDSGLSSSQNLSSVSLNSNDSNGTLDGNSLPFANEDFGTIKERGTSSNVTDRTSEVTSAEQNEVDKKEYAKGGFILKSNFILSSTKSYFQMR